jgi:uncharacterized protein (TIGR02611 family)
VSSIARRISEQREGVIRAQAEAYLTEDETVLTWVRGRRVGGRGDGFVFITPKRVIVHFTGRSDAPGSFEWTKITGWGIVQDARGGPILGLECEDAECMVQLRSSTSAMAERIGRFIEEFASHVPFAREPMNLNTAEGTFELVESVDVRRDRMNWKEKTQRIAITVIGATLVVGGIVLTPLPGPWSFPIVLAGLAVLSKEYDWAKDAREWVRANSKKVAAKFKARRKST